MTERVAAAPGGTVIPIHRAHRQRDTTSYLGIVVFVASWAMLFAALFMSYAVLRIRSSMWPPAGYARLPVGLPFLATLVIGLSSASLSRGLWLVRRGRPERYLRYLVATFVLGAAFLLMQGSVWWSLWQGGLRLRGGIYGGVFYLLTCFHALHVLVGLGFLAWLVPDALGRAVPASPSSDRARGLDLPGRLGRLGVVSIYWHFVGVVWAVMFVILYLV